MSDSERWLLKQIRDHLGRSLELLAGEKPVIAETPQPLGGAMLWWRQPFSLSPLAQVRVGAPEAAWREIGSRVLRASGIGESTDAEVQSTYRELLSQMLSGVAAGLAERLGREVSCQAGAEEAPAADEALAGISIRFQDGAAVALLVGWSPGLIALLNPAAVPATRDQQPAPEPSGDAGVPASVETSKTLDLLLEVELPVSVSFGRAQLRLKDVIKLSTGSIVELNRSVSEPVEVIVNNCVIARGEVVVLEGYYGVRIQQIISRQERLRTLV